MLKLEEDTICELIIRLKSTDLTEQQRELVELIKNSAESMEDRLLAYCNSIENLGFNRIGRNYSRQ